MDEQKQEEAAQPTPQPTADESWPWPKYPRGAKRNYRREIHEPFTGWEGDYLDVYRDTGIKRAAAQATGVSTSLVEKRRKSDPDFARALQEAREEAVDTLEAAALKRARDGVKRVKPIYWGGKKVGEEVITEYSDALLKFLLVANRPEKYRETVDHNYNVTVIRQEAERIAEQQGLDKELVVEEAMRIFQNQSQGSK